MCELSGIECWESECGGKGFELDGCGFCFFQDEAVVGGGCRAECDCPVALFVEVTIDDECSSQRFVFGVIDWWVDSDE